MEWTQSEGKFGRVADACSLVNERLKLCGSPGGEKVYAINRDGVPGLAGTLSCSCRVCPVCQSAKVSERRKIGTKVVQEFLNQSPSNCLFFITLTIPRVGVRSFRDEDDIEAMLNSERLARATYREFGKTFARILRRLGVVATLRASERQLNFGIFLRKKREKLGSHLHFHVLAFWDSEEVGAHKKTDELSLSKLFWRQWNDCLVRLVTRERLRNPDFASWVKLRKRYPTPVMRPVRDKNGDIRGGVTVKLINRESALSVVNYIAGDSIAAGISGELANGLYKLGSSRQSVSWLGALKMHAGPNWALARDAYRYNCLASRGERVFEYSRLKDKSTGKLRSFPERLLGEEERPSLVIEVEAVAKAGDYYQSKSRGSEFEMEMLRRKEGVTASFGGVAGFQDIDMTADDLAAELTLAAEKRAAGRAKWLAFHKGSTSIWVREHMAKLGFKLISVKGDLSGKWIFTGPTQVGPTRREDQEDLGEI